MNESWKGIFLTIEVCLYSYKWEIFGTPCRYVKEYKKKKSQKAPLQVHIIEMIFQEGGGGLGFLERQLVHSRL